MPKSYEELWKEIDQIVGIQYAKKQPYEKSIRELARLWNVSERRATGMAEKLITDGKLISRVVFARNGKECVIYAPIISL